jgi:hypothetical protein
MHILRADRCQFDADIMQPARRFIVASGKIHSRIEMDDEQSFKNTFDDVNCLRACARSLQSAGSLWRTLAEVTVISQLIPKFHTMSLSASDVHNS